MKASEFQKLVWNFYAKNRRTFPWRETPDPYAILVSELMLQQTQTYRVVPKFLNWMHLFPTVDSLAAASLADVLHAWSGLGYNRRVKFLWKTAGIVQATYNSQIPKTYEDLRTLPGIGEYTANAILTFAFNQPTIVLETNIRTAVLHHFYTGRTGISDKELKLVLQAVLDVDHPRDWYYALMDYGNWLKSEGIKTFHQQKSYAKQKPFKGSERFIRGTLLREVLKQRQVKLSAFILPGYTKLQIRKVANDLITEGFAKEPRKGYLEVV